MMQKPIKEVNRRKFIKNFSTATAAIALSPALSACATERKKPNIVYVLTDQWRSSAIGHAGDPNVRTPNIDRLALESYNFRNAVSVCPVCTPYRASLLTGRYPASTPTITRVILLRNCTGMDMMYMLKQKMHSNI